MSVSKTNVVARNARVMATEEGITVLLDIATNVDAYAMLVTEKTVKKKQG